MEELLLGLLLAGDELDIVHQQEGFLLVFIPEFRGSAAPDGLDQFIGEVHALHQHDAALRAETPGLSGDGVEQVGLAQSAVAVDEQGVEGTGRLFRHTAGGGVGHLVLRAHHVGLKGEGLAVGQRVGVVGPHAVIGGQLLVVQQLHLQIGGEDIPQRLLDLGYKAFFDGTFLKHVAAVQHQCGILHGHHRNLVKPGVDGGVGELFFQSVKYCFPYVGQ